MKVLSLNRFEGRFAVLEDDNRKIYKINKKEIRKNSKEGDIFLLENNKITFDPKRTEKKRKEIRALENEIFGI